MDYKNKLLTFSQATAIRSVRTFCQTAVALIGTNVVGVTEVDWVGVVSGAALSAIISALMSVGTGLPEVSEEASESEE